MKKILFVFGTRPEAIKLAPVIKEFQKSSLYHVLTCSTGQHIQLMDGIFEIFDISIDYNLNVLNPGDSLDVLYIKIIEKLRNLFVDLAPDLVVVHGDTISTLASAMLAFLMKIPIAHIEAGLRTYNKLHPWPEEINRTVVGSLADFHFSPTENAANNLMKINTANVFVVGNTVIDSVKFVDNFIINSKVKSNELLEKFNFLDFKKKIVLITLHRRENYGEGFRNVCHAIKKLSEDPNIQFVFPVHFNPNVKEVVSDILQNVSNVFLIKPLGYLDFIFLMSKSFSIITDSGGIQEEATYFKIPIFICRNTTERPEVVQSGIAKLVGTNMELLIKEVNNLISSPSNYTKVKSIPSPFGSGDSSSKIYSLIHRLI